MRMWDVNMLQVRIKRHEVARLSSMRWTSAFVLARRPTSLSPKMAANTTPTSEEKPAAGRRRSPDRPETQTPADARTWTALSLQALNCSDSLQRKQLRHTLKAEKTS